MGGTRAERLRPTRTDESKLVILQRPWQPHEKNIPNDALFSLIPPTSQPALFQSSHSSSPISIYLTHLAFLEPPSDTLLTPWRSSIASTVSRRSAAGLALRTLSKLPRAPSLSVHSSTHSRDPPSGRQLHVRAGRHLNPFTLAARNVN